MRRYTIQSIRLSLIANFISGLLITENLGLISGLGMSFEMGSQAGPRRFESGRPL